MEKRIQSKIILEIIYGILIVLEFIAIGLFYNLNILTSFFLFFRL